MTTRQRLRAVVWEMTGGQCEWPGCTAAATELAHITPRGMGHTGYRDRLGNVMAACHIHARVTDDMSSDEWDVMAPFAMWRSPGSRRWRLAEIVNGKRIGSGFDVKAMQTELDADDE